MNRKEKNVMFHFLKLSQFLTFFLPHFQFYQIQKNEKKKSFTQQLDIPWISKVNMDCSGKCFDYTVTLEFYGTHI